MNPGFLIEFAPQFITSMVMKLETWYISGVNFNFAPKGRPKGNAEGGEQFFVFIVVENFDVTETGEPYVF